MFVRLSFSVTVSKKLFNLQSQPSLTTVYVVSSGHHGHFRSVKTVYFSVLKDYYHFMSVERPIINTSLVLDPPFRYHVTDPTCNRANIRCMDFLRKVSSFQVNR